MDAWIFEVFPSLPFSCSDWQCTHIYAVPTNVAYFCNLIPLLQSS